MRWLLCLPLLSYFVSARSAALGEFDGTWLSRGYGTVVSIREGQVEEFDIDDQSCHVRAAKKPIAEFLSDLRLAAHGALLLGNDLGNITRHSYDRVGALPNVCRTHRGSSRDALQVFDAFWQIFAEHYAFFHERGVDWQRLREKFRLRVSSHTSDSELFNILRDMLSATGDLHVSLEAGDREFIPALTSFMYELWDEYAHLAAPRPSLEHFLKSRSRAYVQPTLDRYLQRQATRVIDDNVMVGSIEGSSIGYLQVLGEDGFVDQSHTQYRLKPELDAALAVFNEAFTAVAKAPALILDLRINYGGQDAVSLDIAGRLTPKPRLGFSKCARTKRGYTEAQVTRVPVRTPGFLGPVVVLVSEHTISAGDEILMIVKDFPNVVIVGSTSAGDYSDPLRKTLPNGWSVGLSNERYIAPDGRVYEPSGIEPDIRVGFHPQMMQADGRDPGLEKALDVLDMMRRYGRAALPKAPAPPPSSIVCGKIASP